MHEKEFSLTVFQVLLDPSFCAAFSQNGRASRSHPIPSHDCLPGGCCQHGRHFVWGVFLRFCFDGFQCTADLCIFAERAWQTHKSWAVSLEMKLLQNLKRCAWMERISAKCILHWPLQREKLPGVPVHCLLSHRKREEELAAVTMSTCFLCCCASASPSARWSLLCNLSVFPLDVCLACTVTLKSHSPMSKPPSYRCRICSTGYMF